MNVGRFDAEDVDRELSRRFREVLDRLTEEELDWLEEADDAAQQSVPCPHVESLRCDCRSPERFERAPEHLQKEFDWRVDELMSRSEEILDRPVRERLRRLREPNREKTDEDKG